MVPLTKQQIAQIQREYPPVTSPWAACSQCGRSLLPLPTTSRPDSRRGVCLLHQDGETIPVDRHFVKTITEERVHNLIRKSIAVTDNNLEIVAGGFVLTFSAKAVLLKDRTVRTLNQSQLLVLRASSNSYRRWIAHPLVSWREATIEDMQSIGPRDETAAKKTAAKKTAAKKTAAKKTAAKKTAAN